MGNNDGDANGFVECRSRQLMSFATYRKHVRVLGRSS